MLVKVKAPAKINLTLEIKEKLLNGYHNLESIMQSVSLYDLVTVDKTNDTGIKINCDNKKVPCDETNIAYKSAVNFFKHTRLLNPGISINIEKNIPIAAGLAGGSADGAGVIVALNEILKTNLSLNELCTIAKPIGADIPFCIKGGTMLAEGTGNILTPIKDIPSCYIVLAKPQIDISTKKAYKLIDENECKNISLNYTKAAIKALDNGNLPTLAGNLYNDFEKYTNIPDIKKIKNTMLEQGSIGSILSGSGPTVFGIFIEKEQAKLCYNKLINMYREVFICKPVNHGCAIK